MSAEATHRTLDEFTTESATVDPADAPKTYTARNVRDFLGDRVGTAPRNWVASMIEKFPEAVEIFHVGLSPYRYEINHHQREKQIEEYAEENDTPGVPVDAEEFADDLAEDDYYDCRVQLGTDALVDGKQVIEVDGAVDDYEIHIDPSQVGWTA